MNKHKVIVPISFVVTFSFSLKEVHFPYLLIGSWWVISLSPYLHPWVFHCAFSPLASWEGCDRATLLGTQHPARVNPPQYFIKINVCKEGKNGGFFLWGQARNSPAKRWSALCLKEAKHVILCRSLQPWLSSFSGYNFITLQPAFPP